MGHLGLNNEVIWNIKGFQWPHGLSRMNTVIYNKWSAIMMLYAQLKFVKSIRGDQFWETLDSREEPAY